MGITREDQIKYIEKTIIFLDKNIESVSDLRDLVNNKFYTEDNKKEYIEITKKESCYNSSLEDCVLSYNVPIVGIPLEIRINKEFCRSQITVKGEKIQCKEVEKKYTSDIISDVMAELDIISLELREYIKNIISF